MGAHRAGTCGSKRTGGDTALEPSKVVKGIKREGSSGVTSVSSMDPHRSRPCFVSHKETNSFNALLNSCGLIELHTKKEPGGNDL